MFEDDVYEAASHAGVLNQKDLDAMKDPLKSIRPMKAVFDRHYVRRLDGPHVKQETSKWDQAQAVREDIQRFKADNDLDRLGIEGIPIQQGARSR